LPVSMFLHGLSSLVRLVRNPDPSESITDESAKGQSLQISLSEDILKL